MTEEKILSRLKWLSESHGFSKLEYEQHLDENYKIHKIYDKRIVRLMVINGGVY